MAIAYQDVLEGLGLHTQIVDEAVTHTSEPEAHTSEPEAHTSEPEARTSEAVTHTPEVAAEAAEAVLETPDPEAETPEASTSADSDTTPGLTTPEVEFSPGIWGWTILMGVGLLIAASVLVEALVVRDQTIPMNATTLHAAGWAVAGVLTVALGSYLLGWLVWLLGKRKSGGGRMVFCLFVLLFGAGAVWINAEKLLVKIEHVRDQRASITTVQSAFDSMLNERSQVYNQAAKGVELNVGAIRQRQAIEDMRKTLSAFLEASTKLGELQLEGDKYLSEQLAKAGVEPHRAQRIVNDYRAMTSVNRSFNAATRHYEAEVVTIWMDMLDLLESSWGRWEPDPENSSILTDDTELQDSYNVMVERLVNENRKAPQSPAG